MKNNILTILLFCPLFIFGQNQWTSARHNYSIEIPTGFVQQSNRIGSNVDFKAVKGSASIVIVVKTLPSELSGFTIWQTLGDLSTFGREWEMGAREYFNNPRFLKYGKTVLSGYDTFWYDYTTDFRHDYITDILKLHTKNYQVKKGNKIYTITLTCNYADYNHYSAIWYRFKDKIRLY